MLFLLVLSFLLGICVCSSWNALFPLHAPALIPLFLAKVRFSPTLTLSPLMIWCFGLTALFLFLLARAAPAFLPTGLSVTLRPPFPFRQAQYAQVFPLKPAPFCTLFAGLGSTNKSAIFLLFSSCLTLVLSSPPCPFLLSQTLWQIWQELSSLSSIYLSGYNGLTLSDYNESLDTRFSRGTTRLMGWPDGGATCAPSNSLWSLSSYFSYPLFVSRTGGVLSHRSSLTHRFPRFPPTNLCSVVMLAVSSLVFAATDTAFC